MKFTLTPDQYAQIETKIQPTGTEDYAVTVQRRHGKAVYGVHVFERGPSTKELVKYEDEASRIKYKGNQAQLEGSVLLAAKHLYDLLIARAYDIQVGRTLHETLTREDAARLVPDLTKREAIREFLGNVSGLTSITADEETGDDSAGRLIDAE